MCLITNDATIHTAKENILVYKVLTFGGFSPYEEFPYKFFKKYIVQKLGINSSLNYFLVDKGFHTFICKKDAVRWRKTELFQKVSLFIIPKGSQYVLGVWYSTCVLNIVSDQIIRIGGGLFAWWWKRKNTFVEFSDYDPESLVKLKQYYNIQ